MSLLDMLNVKADELEKATSPRPDLPRRPTVPANVAEVELPPDDATPPPVPPREFDDAASKPNDNEQNPPTETGNRRYSKPRGPPPAIPTSATPPPTPSMPPSEAWDEMDITKGDSSPTLARQMSRGSAKFYEELKQGADTMLSSPPPDRSKKPSDSGTHPTKQSDGGGGATGGVNFYAVEPEFIPIPPRPNLGKIKAQRAGEQSENAINNSKIVPRSAKEAPQPAHGTSPPSANGGGARPPPPGEASKLRAQRTISQSGLMLDHDAKPAPFNNNNSTTTTTGGTPPPVAARPLPGVVPPSRSSSVRVTNAERQKGGQEAIAKVWMDTPPGTGGPQSHEGMIYLTYSITFVIVIVTSSNQPCSAT